MDNVKHATPLSEKVQVLDLIGLLIGSKDIFGIVTKVAFRLRSCAEVGELRIRQAKTKTLVTACPSCANMLELASKRKEPE